MSEAIISVKNLGKKYRITRGAERQRYVAMRDVIADRFGALFRRSYDGARSSTEDFWALKDVCFEVKQGEVVGIIGRNGAGKSTLLKILSRITDPTEGRVRLKGRVASLLEVGTGFHPELTGRENIFLNGAILGMRRREITKRFDEIVAFSEIEKFLDTPVKHYSSGMHMRLAFAVAAHLEPEILIIDEVLAVGDAEFQKKCLGKMESVGRSGRTVLFVSHNMAAVERLCSRALLLKSGLLSMEGDVLRVVNEYLNSSGSTRSPKAIKYSSSGVEVSELDFETIDNDFVISCIVRSTRPTHRLGVGVGISSPRGEVIARLSPFKTGVIVQVGQNEKSVQIRMPNLLSLLPEGEYHVAIWFSEPGVEILLSVDHAHLLTVPHNDAYSTGHSIKQFEDGLAVLPIELTRSKEHHEVIAALG